MDDIIGVNVFMFFIWTMITVYMIPFTSVLSYILLVIPVIIIVINILDVNKTTYKTERIMFQNSSIGTILIVIGLFVGTRLTEKKIDKKFSEWILLAIILAVFSSYDIWVSETKAKALQYFRSLCEAFCITIFLIIMIEFFLVDRGKPKDEPENLTDDNDRE